MPIIVKRKVLGEIKLMDSLRLSNTGIQFKKIFEQSKMYSCTNVAPGQCTLITLASWLEIKRIA